MKNRYLLAMAGACALVIVTTESQAQQHPLIAQEQQRAAQSRANVIMNSSQVNNWNTNRGNGWGWQQPNQTYNYNCTGCYAGSGPYDSNIAVTGIGAAAGIIGALIQNNRPAPQAPPVVIYAPQPGQPQPIVVYPQGQNVSR